MATQRLKFNRLHVITERIDEHRRWHRLPTPEVVLSLSTPAGMSRESEPLTRTQLLDLIYRATDALARLDGVRLN